MNNKNHAAIDDVVVDFCLRYPLGKFIPEDYLAEGGFALAEDVSVNVIFSGFGELSLGLFETLFSSFQFMRKCKDGFVPVVTGYFAVCDEKEIKSAEKKFYDGFFRYLRFCKNMADTPSVAEEYLPVAPLTCDFRFIERKKDVAEDISGVLRSVMSAGGRSVNFLFIDCGENNDRIVESISRQAFGNNAKAVFFVRGKVKRADVSLVNYYDDGSDDRIKSAVGTARAFVEVRNALYKMEHERVCGQNFSLNKKIVKRKNGGGNASDRQSVCAAFGLLSYLAILGFDVCDSNDKREAVTDGEYNEIFARSAGEDEKENSRTLASLVAECEHYRWNACLIAQGYIPATKDEILNDRTITGEKSIYTDGKDEERKTHGNLTDFSGLLTFAGMISERDNITFEEADVIRYDYQLCENAPVLIRALNKKICRRAGR